MKKKLTIRRARTTHHLNSTSRENILLIQPAVSHCRRQELGILGRWFEIVGEVCEDCEGIGLQSEKRSEASCSKKTEFS